jgi:hypothetical protein
MISILWVAPVKQINRVPHRSSQRWEAQLFTVLLPCRSAFAAFGTKNKPELPSILRNVCQTLGCFWWAVLLIHTLSLGFCYISNKELCEGLNFESNECEQRWKILKQRVGVWAALFLHGREVIQLTTDNLCHCPTQVKCDPGFRFLWHSSLLAYVTSQ